jgi:glycerol uptake facilitator-like aquaporin
MREQAAPPLRRRLLAELLGSAFLAAVVIGSGIAAARLSPADAGLRLLENAAATAAGLFAIILMFGPVSGGHFNPVVSLVDASFRGISWRDAIAYVPAQVSGCVLGAITANAMFAAAAVSISTHHRASIAHLFAEVIATLGLLLVIFSLARTKRSASAPAAVGAYIGAAYFFTSSTSFANPAITIGRMFSNTFAGIAPASVTGFVVAQLVGAAVAVLAIKTLYPTFSPAEAAEVVVDRGTQTEADLPALHERGDAGGAHSPPRSLAQEP